MGCGVMENKQTVYDKSEDFAVRIINLYKHLCENKKEFVLSKQILRSGTSIVANLSEAKFAISRQDWLAKVYISLKECAETACWLRLLKRTDFINEQEFNSIYDNCEEIRKMLNSSTKTMRENIQNEKK